MKNLSKEKKEVTFNEMINQYANSMMGTINQINSLSNYMPQLGQDYTQSINISPRKPTVDELTTWLSNPSRYGKQLKDASEYIENNIMQYQRVQAHFSSLLTFKYDLRPVDMAKTPSEIKQWLSGRERSMGFLKGFNVKYNLENVMQGIMDEGGKFYYFIEDDYVSYLQELPRDFCYITGKWAMGFTFAIDLAYFDKFQGLESAIPELYEYYRMFIEMRDTGLRGDKLAPYQYYPVPIEKGCFFTFNPIKASCTPPLSGVMQDALEIIDYKALLKQKTALDTWKIIAQKIPQDKDGKLMVDAKVAQNFVSMTDALLPSGVKTFASPLEMKELKFSESQTQNNITGTGEQLFWRSVGVNGSLLDLGDKSAASLRYSLINDEGFIDHMYRQFENFLNLQMWFKSRKYRFRVKMYGNRYTDDESLKSHINAIKQLNAPVQTALAYMGYEPFEVDAVLLWEELSGIKDKMQPIISGFNVQQDSEDEGGRPESDLGDLSDAGEQTRDDDENATSLKT